MAKKFSQLIAAMPPERQARIEQQTQAMFQEYALEHARKSRENSEAELICETGHRQPTARERDQNSSFPKPRSM